MIYSEHRSRREELTGKIGSKIKSKSGHIGPSAVECRIVEYLLERNHWEEGILTTDRDIADGFRVTGPGVEGEPLKFTHYSVEEAKATTPWGSMSIAFAPSAGFSWDVRRGGAPTVNILVKPEHFIELKFRHGYSIRLMNRTGARARVYRYRSEEDMAEIRTTWSGLFYSDRGLSWRISLSGFSTIGVKSIVSSLVLFVCYWKIYAGMRARSKSRKSYFSYDEMF